MINHEALAKHRADLKKELKDLLKSNQRVACVQPTGMGKSHIIAELCSEFKGKKLVLEPGNSIINYMEQFDIETPNTDYITYHSLLRPDVQDIVRKFKDYDYIFLDEIHRALAETWGTKLMDVLSNLDKITTYKLIGFSATPIRSDNRDAVEEIFNNIQTKPYYLADAILDNLLPNLNYYTSIYEITDEQQERLIQKNTPIAKAILSYDINEGVSNIISNIIDLSINHKIICFVDKINNIPEAIYNIKRWFKIDVNIFEMHSRNAQRKNNKILEEFQTKAGVNILFAVNILNEGVHVPGVDTVIFLRKTKSNIVYNQQLGRVISDFNEDPVVLDLVNNSENLAWGYSMIFNNKSRDFGIPVENITCKNGETLNITICQSDIINKLKNVFKSLKITPEVLKYFKEHEGEFTAEELAKKFNTSASYIRDICRIHNIKYKKTKEKQLLDKDIKYLKEHEGEFTAEELAKKLNVKIDIIYAYCRIHNIKYKRYGNKDNIIERIKEIKLLNIKLSKNQMLEIAKSLGITKRTFATYCRQFNIDYERTIDRRLILNRIKYLKEHEGELSLKELAKNLDTSIGSIRSLCNKNNIKYKTKNFRVNDKDIKYLKEHEGEFTIKELNKILGYNENTIRTICFKNNIKFKYAREGGSK